MLKYVINLDRRTDRLKHTEQEFSAEGLDFIRFSAFDTKPGWKGCRDSHIAIMELCKNEEKFAIFEDDVKFLMKLEGTIGTEQLPTDWDCLYLGASPKEPQVRYSENLFRLKNAHVTHAIIWHNRKNGAVEYILSHRGDIRKYDDYLATVIQPMFNCFVIYPMVATQVQFQSDTCKRSDVSTILTNYNKYCYDSVRTTG